MSFFGNLELRIDKRLPEGIVAFQHPSGRVDMFRLWQDKGESRIVQLTAQQVHAVMLGINTVLDMDKYLLVVEGTTYLQEIQQALVDGRIDHAQKVLSHFHRVMEGLSVSPRATTLQPPRTNKHI